MSLPEWGPIKESLEFRGLNTQKRTISNDLIISRVDIVPYWRLISVHFNSWWFSNSHVQRLMWVQPLLIKRKAVVQSQALGHTPTIKQTILQLNHQSCSLGYVEGHG